MKRKGLTSSPPASARRGGFCVLCLLCALCVFTSLQAQTRDIITITGAKAGVADDGASFKTGTASSDYPGMYVVDVGDASVEEGTFTVTLRRPLGATAKRAATVTLSYMPLQGVEMTEIFEPGETEKTVELPGFLLAANYDPTECWSGNLPAMYTIRTTYAEAEYDALMIKVNRIPTEEVPQCELATKLEVLQNTQGNDHAFYDCYRWGDYLLMRFFLATYVKVGADSRYVINARFVDHTNLTADDDYGLAQTHEVELHPINAGSVCSEAWYLYRPSNDEYLHSLDYNIGDRTEKAVQYPVLEVGPFEVANPAEDAVKYIFYSRADLPEESANALFPVYLFVDGLMPQFSNVSINKTSFKSGETMVITATMDNWQFVKRGQGKWFRTAFGVTLDDNQTLESCRYTLDEATGRVTYYVTAPTVDEMTTINVDFGAVKDDVPGGDKVVISRAESSFAVTVSPETAAGNPVTKMEFVGLPAEGNAIVLKKEVFGGGMGEIVRAKKYPLIVDVTPMDATDANEITYSVTNSGEASAFINYGDGFNGSVLNTGQTSGTITVTASLPSGVSVSRTFSVVVGNGNEEELLAMPEPMNHSNKYFVGTVFPQFQFELKNPDNWPVDDAITVNYTHANGTAWTETYSLKKLKSRESDRNTIIYDLPFSFTEEHPDATDDSQVGNTVITAQVIIGVPTLNGPKETIECSAMLVSDLRTISFGDYREMTAYYNEVHPVTITSEVMYLPRKGFTVGYEIPELGVKETYNNLTDGDNVPDWLDLQVNDNEYYYTANISVQPNFDHSISQYHFYTLGQRSYSPDEVMLREMTTIANLEYVGAEGHLVFRVNGQDVTGDLTFDDGDAINDLIHNKILPTGFMESDNRWNHPFDLYKILMSTFAIFTVYDDVYEGADVTLKCGDEVIQTIKQYKGKFSFLPPIDGRTYTIEVYYPSYDRRYTSTFVSHPFTNIYRINIDVDIDPWIRFKTADVLRCYDNGTPWELTFPYIYEHRHNGYVYLENPTDFYLGYKYTESGIMRNLVRIGGIPLHPITADIKPQLCNLGNVYSKEKAYEDSDLQGVLNAYLEFGKCHWGRFGGEYRLSWERLAANNTLVTVVNSQGQPVNDAELHYGCVDTTMTLQGNAGSTTYDSNLKAYQIESNPDQYAEFIEVVTDGYQPMLAKMYMSDYDYSANSGHMRRYTIVLDENPNPMKSLALETMERNGNLKDNKMQCIVNYNDLLMADNSETLDYSETADYATVTKYMNEGKFGKDGWHGTKWVHLTGQMDCDADFDVSQLRLQGGELNLEPTLAKVLSPQEFTTFSRSYCLFDFDLSDQIAEDATVKPVLKSGTTTLAEIPSLHNQTIDLMALNEASNINMDPGGFELTEVDNQASSQGVDMKDMGKAFDKFNFQMPPGLPFTVNIERNGDYFRVRAVCEKNFVPGGEVMDVLDQLEDLQYFDEQFQACMDAVNSAQPADDDFFDDIPRWPSAFVGIKGYLSGIGYYNREKNKFEINFLEGGLTFEASAAAQANLSFGIGSFGMSIDAKMAMTMGLVNTAAEMGDVSIKSTKIDFMFDYQTRLKVCAWAYAGIDLWIAKAVCGVRGGACIDLHHRAYIRKGQAGMKTTLQAQMEAFAEARFLFWKAKKTWPIFKAYKEYLVPNNPSNPFHPDNDEPIFDLSRRNVTKGYKKLKRKVIADLGTPIISNVNGMAQPNYLMDGESLLFNNLKTPKNYNDDRLQVYADGDKSDFVNTGINAPMYDFGSARNPYFEMVAFEQLNEAVDGNAIDAMAENDQTKAVSEKSRVHIAWRRRDDISQDNQPMKPLGSWHTKEITSMVNDNVACVNPAVAVTSDAGVITDVAKGAVIWQQGVTKFNNEGNRYIDGSLMLKRFTAIGDDMSEPIEIKRLNRRSVPADYQVALKDDSILVMMALQQDIENQNKGASMVYVSISPDDKVRERYTMIEGSKPQMVNVNSGILVAYLQQKSDGRDLVLNTVNMRGESTGKVSGPLGMNRRMVNDYKLVYQYDRNSGASLDKVALLWSQSDEEKTDNADGTTTVIFKNRLFASRLCSNDNELYFSAPVEIATMPDDVTLVSMDGFLDGLDMKVVYCVANEEDGAAIMETNVEFTNAIDHRMTFNPYEVTDKNQIPVTVKVVNNGYEPISRIDLTLGGQLSQHLVSLMPQQATELTAYYDVPEDFDGTIDYEVAANFTINNGGGLRSRRNTVQARPHRIAQNGTQTDIRQMDMALKVISKRTVGEVTTIVAEVNNASLLPLANDLTVKVGLYDSPLATEKAAGTTEVTVTAADLYDATGKQNKVKIVSLTAEKPDFDQVLYLRTTPMQGGEVVADVHPTNNVLPVRLTGKLLKGDVNLDGKVDLADVKAVYSIIAGTATDNGHADVNNDGVVGIADIIAIANIMAK